MCGGERERMGQGTESGRQEDEGGGTGPGDGGKRLLDNRPALN